MGRQAVTRRTRFDHSAAKAKRRKEGGSRKRKGRDDEKVTVSKATLNKAVRDALSDPEEKAAAGRRDRKAKGGRWVPAPAPDPKAQQEKDAGGATQRRKRPGRSHANLTEFYEYERQKLVRSRNRVRRMPWLPGAVGVALGSFAHWASELISETLHASGAIVVLILAAVPLCAALVLFGQRSDDQRERVNAGWWPELVAGGIGGATVVLWIGTAGFSWPVVGLVFAATVVGGRRVWKSEPIDPGVEPLKVEIPERPAPAPAPEPEPIDEYAAAWAENNASNKGKAPESMLTNRERSEFVAKYLVELKKGAQSYKDLLANREALAGGLGEDAERVLFSRAPRGLGASKAVMRIIIKDPVEEVRFFEAPRFRDGKIVVGRFIDGSGDAEITIYDDGGMVPTMVVGSTGGGKSGAANLIIVTLMSSKKFELIYLDPKGNSSTALASRARVAIIGKDNVLKAPALVRSIVAKRAELAAELGEDQLFPSAEIPGLIFLHDEYSLIAKDTKASAIWTEIANIVRSLAIVPIALNQSQGQPEWGSDHGRSAFASSVVAFRTNSKSSSDLVPGLLFDPNELPVNEEGRPVPGMAVHSHRDTPVRWDFLPSDSNAKKMEANGEPAPMWTATTAFDHFFAPPGLHPLDIAAITAILGPPVNGRWQVGGRNATHAFPEDIETMNQALAMTTAAAAVKIGSWGTDLGPVEPGKRLNPTQSEVLGLVRKGLSQFGEIVAACSKGRSAVKEALDVLIERELIEKDGHNNYRPVAQEEEDDSGDLVTVGSGSSATAGEDE